MEANLVEAIYVLMGVVVLGAGVFVLFKKDAKQRRLTSLFFVVLGSIVILGKHLPGYVSGIALLILACLSMTKKVVSQKLAVYDESLKKVGAQKYGLYLFLPAVFIGVGSALMSWLFRQYFPSWRASLGTLVALGLATILAFILALFITRTRPLSSLKDGSSLALEMGSMTVIPPLLAALGSVYTKAGVGLQISSLLSFFSGGIFFGVVVYCVGMALFTVVMGNAFAAFSVITVGVGIPLVYSKGADPAIAGLLAMTAGYCGTLMTPMAANFNLVPAVLLETKSPYAVIKRQLPLAFLLLVTHIFLMYYFAFPNR